MLPLVRLDSETDLIMIVSVNLFFKYITFILSFRIGYDFNRENVSSFWV